MGNGQKGEGNRERRGGFFTPDPFAALSLGLLLATLVLLGIPEHYAARRQAAYREAEQTLELMRRAAWAHYLRRGSFDGYPTATPPPTPHWRFGYGPCRDGVCLLRALGREGTPVAGATVVVTLRADGTAEVASYGF
ncbi:MAG: hypothetical protein QN193_08195 [Armatimonadota bacterium]|nr:hypothetical protein [Armatimonadota bacterium]MDR7570574.1 hypothetical protein [Armatimonadota bacterium]